MFHYEITKGKAKVTDHLITGKSFRSEPALEKHILAVMTLFCLVEVPQNGSNVPT